MVDTVEIGINSVASTELISTGELAAGPEIVIVVQAGDMTGPGTIMVQVNWTFPHWSSA